MITMRKPILLLAAAMVAAVLIVFCSALIWIKSTPGLNWIQSRINSTIPGKITIQKHRLSLLTPSLDLYHVVIHDPSGLALAGFTHLAVALDWSSLWRGEIRLERILLQTPWADLAIDENAVLNLVKAMVPPAREDEKKAPASESAGWPFNIVFKSIQLTDGRFSFRSSDDTTRLDASGITLSADGNLLDRSGSLDLDLAHVRFSSAGIHPEPGRIVAKARLDGDQLSVAAIDVISGLTTLRFSGSVKDLYTRPTIDSDLSLNSRLSEIKTILNLAGDYAGLVEATLTLKGRLDNPDAGLVLAVEDTRLAGQPVGRGDLSINLQDRQVEMESAAFRLADGVVSLKGSADLRAAFPTGFLASPTDIDRIAYHIDLVQDTPDLTPWLNRFVNLSGRMTSRLSLSGQGVTLAGMSAKLSLDGSGNDLLAPGMDRPINADVNLAAQMERGKISLSHLDTIADGFELSGAGHFQIDDQTLAGNLALTSEDLSQALAVAGLTLVDGACNAALTVGGSLSQPQFSANLLANNLKIDVYTLGNVSIEAEMDPDGQLHLTHLALQNKDSQIRGNGRLRLLPNGDGIDPAFINTLGLTVENVSAADFMPAPPLDGTLHGQLKLDGPLASLSGDLSLNGKALKANAATIGDVDTRLRLNDGKVMVHRLHLKNQGSTFTATGNIQLLTPGTLQWLQDPPFDFSAASDHLDPGHFIDMASGDFTFNAELAGRLKNPIGVVSLAGSQANLAGQPVETIALEARFEEQQLWLDRIQAVFAPGEQIEGRGWLKLDKTVDLHLKSNGIATSRIYRLNDFFPGEGRLHIDMSAQGSIENPDIDGRLTVTDIIINEEAIDDIDLTVSLHDMQAKAKGRLNFEMDAASDLKKGDFDVKLTFDRTETSAYFKAAGKPGFHGTLTGSVIAAGNIRDAVNASAQVDLSALHLMFEEISLVQSDSIALQLADRELSVSEFDMALLSEGHLRLQGAAHLDGRLDMAVDGRIPLAVARRFSDELADATGIVTLEGSISGETSAPQFDARINLEHIGMTVPGLVQRIRDLNGRIQLDAERIRIDAFEGFLDTGSFAVAGTIDHDQLQPIRIDLGIKASSLPLEIRDTLAVLVNGDIRIEGEDRSANARGEIILLEGVYYKDVDISLLQMASSATTRRRTVAAKSRALSIPYFDTVNLNIAVGHRQPFVVQNNLADLEISPALKIGGTLANPIVSGRAEVRHGTVTFQRKIFDVIKGVIYFANPYKTEVEIDIESETEIRTWRINLAIKGTPDNLKVTMTSQPQETEADILSLILFGRTGQELTSGGGGVERTTGQIMAEMLVDTFGDDLKKSSGVDILRVETAESSGGQDADGVKVTVGKHLSDRLTVKYALETINGETLQWAIMEYKLLERILVNGSQSTSGSFGAELVYRIEFR